MRIPRKPSKEEVQTSIARKLFERVLAKHGYFKLMPGSPDLLRNTVKELVEEGIIRLDKTLADGTEIYRKVEKE